MRTALTLFHSLIEHTEVPKGLYRYLKEQKISIDASDLLRWEWVQAVSALDRFIHDIVRIGMVEAFQGKRSQTDKFKNFQIDMTRYKILRHSLTPDIEFQKEVIRKHSYLAFQHPDKISDALSYIWPEKHKWRIISQNMTTPIPEADLKTKLNNIAIRRDQIVHEGDYLLTSPHPQQQIICEADVNDVVNFITELANAIFTSVV